jgi:hypothetical protein
MPRMYSATGRSRWPYVAAGLLSVMALGGGVAVALTTQDAPDLSAVAESPTAAPTLTPAAPGTGVGDNEDVAPPTGCLGGLDRDAAMVLAAQKEASHTPYGAVEVATAFYRFVWQSPVPSTEDLDSVSRSLMAKDANLTFRDLAGSYADVPDFTGGVVTAGRPFHLSTTNGIWLIDSDATGDRVTVDVATGYVIDGALSPSKVAAIGMTMVWEQGAWRLLEGAQIDQAKVANGGIRYTGGC